MSLANKVRNFVWNRDADGREVIVIAAAIVLVIALIGNAR